MKRKIIIPFAVLILIAVDQLVKLYIVSDFKLGQVKSFIPHLVSRTYLLRQYRRSLLHAGKSQQMALYFGDIFGHRRSCLLPHQAPHASKWMLMG